MPRIPPESCERPRFPKSGAFGFLAIYLLRIIYIMLNYKLCWKGAIEFRNAISRTRLLCTESADKRHAKFHKLALVQNLRPLCLKRRSSIRHHVLTCHTLSDAD